MKSGVVHQVQLTSARDGVCAVTGSITADILPQQHFQQIHRTGWGTNATATTRNKPTPSLPMLHSACNPWWCVQPSDPAAKTTVPTVAIGGALDKRYTQEQVRCQEWSHSAALSTTNWP